MDSNETLKSGEIVWTANPGAAFLFQWGEVAGNHFKRVIEAATIPSGEPGKNFVDGELMCSYSVGTVTCLFFLLRDEDAITGPDLKRWMDTLLDDLMFEWADKAARGEQGPRAIEQTRQESDEDDQESAFRPELAEELTNKLLNEVADELGAENQSYGLAIASDCAKKTLEFMLESGATTMSEIASTLGERLGRLTPDGPDKDALSIQ